MIFLFTVIANILQVPIDAAESVMLFFHNDLGLAWGFAIIALTVTVRLILLPLTLKSSKSMQKMQQHAPEIKALQQKYKEDPQKLREETMKFYRENQINPLGSCLPLLLQIPVFLSLFYMLQGDLRQDICGQSKVPCGDVDPGSAEFLFIPDLTDKATGAVLVVLIVLYVGSQLASSILMSTTVDKNQRRLMMALPLVFVVFIINFPAGLIVYWITTNVWTIGQQYMVRRMVGPVKPALAKSDDAVIEGLESEKVSPPPPPRKKGKQRSGRRR